MALPVVLKSGKNYITLVLDGDMEFSELLQEILTKFLESERFFAGQSFALMFDGRELEEREKLIILDAIDEYTSVHITRVIENDEFKTSAVDRILNPTEEDLERAGAARDNCVYVDGDVLAGEKIFAFSNVVVRGSVAAGGIVKAGQSVIILGDLEGQAIAGNDPDAVDPYIIAMDFRPENFRIGRVLGQPGSIKKSGLFRKKAGSKIARIVDGEIEISNY